MVSVDHLDVVRCIHSMKISLKVQGERLAIVASQIVDALNFEDVQKTNYHQSLKVDLATLNVKHKAVNKELKQLGIQKEYLHNSILEINENTTNKQNDISLLRK